MKLSAANERIKHRYFIYLREARQLGEHSIDQAAKALDRFEEHSRRRSFRDFRVEQAASFKKHLATVKAKRGGSASEQGNSYFDASCAARLLSLAC